MNDKIFMYWVSIVHEPFVDLSMTTRGGIKMNVLESKNDENIVRKRKDPRLLDNEQDEENLREGLGRRKVSLHSFEL